MIPINHTRLHMEKNAEVGSLAWAVIKKHPFLTVGALGGLGTLAALKAAKVVHPLHQIGSEERKRGLMKDQRSLLKEILLEQKKGNYKKPKSKQKLIAHPLT